MLTNRSVQVLFHQITSSTETVLGLGKVVNSFSMCDASKHGTKRYCTLEDCCTLKTKDHKQEYEFDILIKHGHNMLSKHFN